MYGIITNEINTTIKYSDEIPKNTVSYDDIYQISKNHCSNTRLCSSRYIELEIERHTGPRMLYGKLGFLFEKENNNKMQLTIPYSKRNCIKCKDVILLNKEYCYEGITEEYVSEIVKTICECIDRENDLPCCKITLYNAANCEVGSCQAFYSIIVDIIFDIYMERINPFHSEQDKNCFIEYVNNKMK